VKENGQCTYNVILRRVHETIVVMEKKCVIRIYVCVHVRARSLTYPSCTAHAPYDIVICSLLAPPYFYIFSHKRHDFRNKKSCCILNTCFDFLHTNLSKTFLILRRNQRDIVVNVKTSSCTVYAIPFTF
jgi:hypothetical protein